jgi:hypothetical protein
MTSAVSWAGFEAQAPDLASRVAARFAAHPHHVVGTVAGDGRPRLWGSNIYLAGGEMWFGAMPGSLRVADLGRDPRVAVHSAPLSENLEGGDARVEGVATVLDRNASTEWMSSHLQVPGGSGRPDGDVVLVALGRVVLTEVRGDMLEMSVWEPGGGVRIVQRR